MKPYRPSWLCRNGWHSWRRSDVNPWLRLCRRKPCAATRSPRTHTDAWGRPIPGAKR